MRRDVCRRARTGQRQIDASLDDLAIISSDCGNSYAAPCTPWHGRIISVSGRSFGWPTLADVDADAVFHGEIKHRLEYVDKTVDAEEISLQMAHPIRDFTPEGLRRNMYEIDIDRYVRNGFNRERAIIAVARDRLKRDIRSGLIVDAREIVKRLTDDQVLTLCPNGMPPIFEPFKATKKEVRAGAHEGYGNGIVTIRRDGVSAERIVEVCGL